MPLFCTALPPVSVRSAPPGRTAFRSGTGTPVSPLDKKRRFRKLAVDGICWRGCSSQPDDSCCEITRAVSPVTAKRPGSRVLFRWDRPAADGVGDLPERRFQGAWVHFNETTSRPSGL